MPTTVRVTRKDMRAAVAGDCFRCAVALALQRATGDDHANVYEDDWQLWLEVGSRSVLAPAEVRTFVRALDGLKRDAEGRPVLPRKLTDSLRPPAFTLPDWDDPEWRERCYGCEDLFDPKELDGEGYCEGCRGAGDGR